MNSSVSNPNKSMDPNPIFVFLSVWSVITLKRKIEFAFTLLFILLNGFAEIISLSIVLPFLTLVIDRDRLWSNPRIKDISELFNIQDSYTLLIYVTLALIIAVLICSSFRLFNMWWATRMAFTVSCDLSTQCFSNALYLPYSYHLERNSSETIATITKSVDDASQNIDSTLQFVSSVVIIGSIISALIVINWKITLVSTSVYGLCYFLISRSTKNLLLGSSKFMVENVPKKFKTLQEGLGGIREIILGRYQNYFIENFKSFELSIRKKNAYIGFISNSPRVFLEGISISLIALLALRISNNDYGSFTSLSILGTFALGAQRILPAMQNAYRVSQLITSTRYGVLNAVDLLRRKGKRSIEVEKIDFKNQINLKNLCFSFPSSKDYLFQKFDLSIKAGDRIGIFGTTGSGKSTLVDILMGLYVPQTGTLEIDGKNIFSPNNHDYLTSWRYSIANVPQTIFLTDATFLENIAFGNNIDEIDRELVKESAKQAQISEFIESTSNGYSTYIGERGVRLSGGQRQRIGIARALYKKATLLVFDEATSALDNFTEDFVMNSIDNLDKNITIIIIAHRLRTLNRCNRILEMDSGKIVRELHGSDIQDII